MTTKRPWVNRDALTVIDAHAERDEFAMRDPPGPPDVPVMSVPVGGV